VKTIAGKFKIKKLSVGYEKNNFTEMKTKYLEEFTHKTKSELVAIITNSAQYNGYELEAAHELLRKKTATFSEYKELTGRKSTIDDSDPNSFLNILKWIGVILFFPLSLVVLGYYKNKKAKKEYYANNRPHSERIN
jgi:hypothetical protein